MNVYDFRIIHKVVQHTLHDMGIRVQDIVQDVQGIMHDVIQSVMQDVAKGVMLRTGNNFVNNPA